MSDKDNVVQERERELRAVPGLAIVIPCYNEEEVLPQSAGILLGKLERMISDGLCNDRSKLVFVNDGSKDRTWEIISELHAQNPQRVSGIKLAHNEGHQNALLCGLMTSLANGYDATISLDADLQDDIDVMDQMLRDYRDGCEIVYGVRNNRDTDTGFKRFTAESYYKVMASLGTEVVNNSADYRMMSSVALEALAQYGEVNLFLRGIVPTLGFKTSKAYYRRGERLAGESKYPLGKMVELAIQGITSFSVKPMQWITTLGLLGLVVGIVMLVYTLASWATGHVVAGWGSMMVSIWILGGLILLSLGIIGEYIGKIYLEVKHRPRYIVEKELR